MANTSIYAAFERLWQHVVAALGNKADTSYVDTKLEEITPSPWTLHEETGCFYRQINEGNNHDIEWLNPPMSEPYSFTRNGDGTAIVVGEYRTAERFGGKPVYTCIIDTGASVSSNSSTKEFVSDEFRQVPILIRDEGFAIKQTGLEGRHLPYMETPSVYWSVHAERDTSNNKRVKIFERSHYARTGWKTFVQIWYTYETPFNIT